MYLRLIILTLSLTIVFGAQLLKRDNCEVCSNYKSFTANCATASEVWKCVCSDDKLWSFYSSCYSCVGAPTGAKSNLRSLYCIIAQNTNNIPLSFPFGDGFTNAIGSAGILGMASSTIELGSSIESITGVTSATSMGPATSAASRSVNDSKDTSDLSGSSSVNAASGESSKSSGLMGVSSSKSSSTSKADGNTLLAYQMTIGSFLAYILVML